MVVVPNLIGGMSNNLFQICTCLAYSMRHNIDYCIPKTIQYPHSPDQKVFYSPFLKYCDKELKGIKITYNEPRFEYDEIPKFDCDVLILSGYFQSEKYFEDYREEILRLLNIYYEFNKGFVSIHVRRNDYLNLPNCHPVITLEYIQKGVKYFLDKGYNNFMVVSDDISWCEENLKDSEDCNFYFSKLKTPVEDLILASCCEHSIGSNSAFSWFIYWLNRNEDKIGVFPEKDKWFGENLPHNVNDLYDEKWVLI